MAGKQGRGHFPSPYFNEKETPMAFTKEIRGKIIADFAKRNGGKYDPAAFVADVRKAGATHPAYEWFEWNNGAAAEAYRIWQARMFASGIRIVIENKTVGGNGKFKITESIMPFALSPMSGRGGGGGYHITAKDGSNTMAAYCEEAAASLASWISRYEAAVNHAGASCAGLRSLVDKLEAAAEAPAKSKPARAGIKRSMQAGASATA